MSHTFESRLALIPWIKWYHDPIEKVIQARVEAHGRASEFVVPAEWFVIGSYQTQFMQLAFRHWRKLREEHEAIERVKKELLK